MHAKAHKGKAVTATYVTTHWCFHEDGTGANRTGAKTPFNDDFAGQLSAAQSKAL
jgi:hypothetical protein